MKTYEERMKQIEEHFKNISLGQLEINLERAGLGQIKSKGGLIVNKIMNDNEQVYCTKCEYFMINCIDCFEKSLIDKDCLNCHCFRCDCFDFEDSKRFIERPKYEEEVIK
jgi:hypothetical protein